MSESLSVVVVTYRSASTLPRALRAIRVEAPASTQLVVVENSGDESIEEVVHDVWPCATVIVNAVNRGFAAAVNQALGSASSDVVLLLNPDAEPLPGALRQLVRTLRRHPDAGVVAPRLLDGKGRPVLSCYPFLSLASVAWRHFQLYRVLPDVALGRYRRTTLSPARTAPVAVDWAQGACLLVRRSVFEQVGALDERFVLYCEEVDLALRARKAGWLTYYAPRAVVRHAEGVSTAQVVPLKLASHYLSKVLYFDKHLGPAQTLVLRAMLLIDLCLRALFRTAGVVRGTPPDALSRLVTYGVIARMLAGSSVQRMAQGWRRMATG